MNWVVKNVKLERLLAASYEPRAMSCKLAAESIIP